MADASDAERFILYYDELTEKKPSVPVKAYYEQLIKWGVAPEKASAIIRMADPRKTGYISRNDICRVVNYDPEKPRALKNVKILYSDMPTIQRDSVTMLIMEMAAQKMGMSEMLHQLKSRLRNVYGGDWSCFVTDGRYWAKHNYKANTCLAFTYQGNVYGVHGTIMD